MLRKVNKIGLTLIIMKHTERFSDRVENYVKYRPHYPQAIIPCLEQEAGLKPESVVADIGTGTGISSLLFLEYGNKVFGVEPNTAMRTMADQLRQRYPNFSTVAGTAERTLLPDDCADLIVAGQAFHWFSQGAAQAEFRRIGHKDAYVALMWNERRTDSEFEREYELLIAQYAIDYKETSHRNIGPAQLALFFSPSSYKEHTFRNAQMFDFSGLKGRLLSSSYAPQEDHPSHKPMIHRLEEIFERHKQQGMIKFHYNTRLYIGKL
jgi:ubiquinone/menaquinone biosynthesis C-methylase UbiE